MQSTRTRSIVLADARYPGGRAALVAWDCRDEPPGETSDFLLRAASGDYLLHHYEAPTPAGSMGSITLLDAAEACRRFEALRAKVVPFGAAPPAHDPRPAPRRTGVVDGVEPLAAGWREHRQGGRG